MFSDFKPTGPTRASTPHAGNDNPRMAPVFGIVKNNIDPNRSGRLMVYIADNSSNDPDDPNAWVPVSYMTPFYGWVQCTAGNAGYGDYKTNPSSYGMWYSPPDIGSTVICIFIDGKQSYGFWIGCVPKPEALYMVPAIAAAEDVVINTQGEGQGYGGATRLPVTNMNTNNKSLTDTANFLNEPKPVHGYTAMILNQQGLVKDPLRGPISSSANRESPSRVGWGVSTPGRPIYEGGATDDTIGDLAAASGSPPGLKVVSRRGGHSIVMDDGDIVGRDQLIRIRSAAGHQILMSDDGQTLFIIHSNGQSYIELGKEGTIDMFSTNSVNIRTQGDLNLHADNDINIHAKKKLNIRAEDINVESQKTTNHKIGTNYSVYTKGIYTHKVEGPLSMQSHGPASLHSKDITYINGSYVNLNTGATSTIPEAVPSIPKKTLPDTLYDDIKGWACAPGLLESITSRAPAHTPWVMANQGVDIKTSSNSGDALPQAPSGPVAATNARAAASPSATPVSVAGVATVPPVNQVSAAIDPNTTGAVIGAVAQNAATGPAAAAVAQGAGVIPTTQGQVAVLGKLAQIPAKLETAGVIKPGSTALINSMIQSGANVQTAMTDNLFTGRPGQEDLKKFITNVPGQVAAEATNLQKAQTAMTQAGAMSGKESPGAIAGAVMAGATAGVGATLNSIKNFFGGLKLPGAGNPGVTNGVTSAFTSGNYAGELAQTATGGTGSIASAVNSLGKATGSGGVDPALGVSGSAFKSIINAFPVLNVGVPINLRTLAQQTAGISNAISNGAPPAVVASSIAGTFATIAPALGLGSQTGAAVGLVNSAARLGVATTPGQTSSAIAGLAMSAASIVAPSSAGSIAGVINASAALGSATTPGQAATAIASLASSAAYASGSKSAGSIAGLAYSAAALSTATNPGAANAAITNLAINAARIASPSTAGALAGVINASAALGTATTPASATNAALALANAATQLRSGRGAAALASGVNYLPGGPNAIASIINKSIGGMGIPGTGAISSFVGNTLTSALNKISTQQSAQAGGLPGFSVPTVISGPGAPTPSADPNAPYPPASPSAVPSSTLQKAASGLASAALNLLPPGPRAQLNSAISSLTSNGSAPNQLPTVGLDTFNRGSIEAQAASILGDSRIPKPNFTGEISQSAEALAQRDTIKLSTFIQQANSIQKYGEQVEAAKVRYIELEKTLPKGDPQIEQAKKEWVSLASDMLTRITTLASTA